MISNINVQIKKDIINSIIDKLIKLIIYSYNKMIEKKNDEVLLEDQRRNKLLQEIRKNKSKFKFDYTISQFEPFDENTGLTLGRTDITVFLDPMSDLGITIECKRFLKNEICNSHICSEYIGNGINRFKNHKYPLTYGYCGMLSFVENGDFNKLYSVLSSAFKLENNSSQYMFNYIAKSREQDDFGEYFDIVHIVLNFA